MLRENRWDDMGTYIQYDLEEKWSDYAMDAEYEQMRLLDDGDFSVAEQHRLALESILRWTDRASETLSDRDIIDSIHSVARAALCL